MNVCFEADGTVLKSRVSNERRKAMLIYVRSKVQDPGFVGLRRLSRGTSRSDVGVVGVDSGVSNPCSVIGEG